MASCIGLTALSSPFFKKIPKLELHAHLNGSLSEETLRCLQKLNCTQTAESWSKEDNGFSSLSSCFDVFQIAHSQTKTPEAVKIATLSTIKEFAADGVIYLELRSTPRHEERMSKREYLQSILDAVFEANKTDLGIFVTFLVSINRAETVENAEENVQLALDFAASYPELVVGIDLSGNPAKRSFTDFIPVLSKARKGLLKITLHCAEVENEKEVLEMLNFGPDRLGHLTMPSQDALEKVKELRIPVELCVTSNVKCGTVTSVELHQFRLLHPGHPVILGTDDKGVFDTTLSNEYALIHGTFGLPLSFFWKMNDDAVDFCFASSPVKARLHEKLWQWKEEFL